MENIKHLDIYELCKKSGADILVSGSYLYEKDESQYKTIINSIRK